MPENWLPHAGAPRIAVVPPRATEEPKRAYPAPSFATSSAVWVHTVGSTNTGYAAAESSMASATTVPRTSMRAASSWPSASVAARSR